jgi:hypothetical protein
MKLAAIREKKAHDHKSSSDVGICQPRNAAEAEALWWRGMEAMESRNDAVAFRIFEMLSAYKGDAPPGIVATATAGRDFLDPKRSAEQKARTATSFFSPILIRVFPDEEGKSQ